MIDPGCVARDTFTRCPRYLLDRVGGCRELAAAGHELIEFTTLPREIVAPAHSLDGRRLTASTTQGPTGWATSRGRIGWVVVDVPIRDLDELAALHGCVLEPALRSGTGLLIERGAPAGLGRTPCWLRAEISAVLDGVADAPPVGSTYQWTAGLPAPVRA